MMTPIKPIFWLSLLLAATVSAAQVRQDPDQLTPSEHRRGPNGLEGWKLEGPIPDRPNENFPFILVIAHHGREIRRFEGDAFVWKWMFLGDGKRVAYESGPLHFSLACILADIETGKQLGIYDCFGDLPGNAPEWVKALEANP